MAGQDVSVDDQAGMLKNPWATQIGICIRLYPAPDTRQLDLGGLTALYALYALYSPMFFLTCFLVSSAGSLALIQVRGALGLWE